MNNKENGSLIFKAKKTIITMPHQSMRHSVSITNAQGKDPLWQCNSVTQDAVRVLLS